MCALEWVHVWSIRRSGYNCRATALEYTASVILSEKNGVSVRSLVRDISAAAATLQLTIKIWHNSGAPELSWIPLSHGRVDLQAIAYDDLQY